MILKPFQEDGARRIARFLRNNAAHACYLADEMGLGKTAQAITACGQMDFRNVLVICPSVVVSNWKREIEMWQTVGAIATPTTLPVDMHKLNPPTIKTATTSGQIKLLRGANWAITTYGLAAKSENAERLANMKFQCVILDEAHYCVREDTLIATERGKVPISDIIVGENVWSILNNELTLRPVKAKIQGNSRRLVSFNCKNGFDLTALDRHPVKNGTGKFVKCEKLQINQEVSVVSKAFWNSLPLVALREVLQSPMLEVPSLSQGRLEGTNDCEQPNEVEAQSGKDASHFKTNRPQTCNSRGQRQTVPTSSTEDENLIRDPVSQRANNSGVSDLSGHQEKRLPNLLQSRLCRTDKKDVHRGRWVLASVTKSSKTRQKKRQDVRKTRVDCITIQEFNCATESQARFIDLEVKGTHNYIANGIVVHNCKSTTSQRSKSILKIIWPKIPYRLCLSGTPITDCVLDGYTLFSRMMPDDPHMNNWHAFANRYADQRYSHFTHNKREYYGLKDENAAELSHKIRKHFLIRRLKSEVMEELPPKIFTRITLPKKYLLKVPKDEKEQLELQAQLVIDAIEHNKPPPAIATTLQGQRRQQGRLKVKPAAEFIEEFLEQKIPVVVFTYHKEVMAELSKLLEAHSPSVITGETLNSLRGEAVDRFQNGDTNLFLGQILAAGIGITLTRASHVVLVEHDWSPHNIIQAVDRCHRIGQRDTVNVYSMVVEGSIDERIVETVIRKAEEISKVLD